MKSYKTPLKIGGDSDTAYVMLDKIRGGAVRDAKKINQAQFVVELYWL